MISLDLEVSLPSCEVLDGNEFQHEEVGDEQEDCNTEGEEHEKYGREGGELCSCLEDSDE